MINAVASFSGRVLILDCDAHAERRLIRFGDEKTDVTDDPTSHHLLSVINDWEIVHVSGDETTLIDHVTRTYNVRRSQQHAMNAISGLSEELTREILVSLETSLQTCCDLESVLSGLLIAPLLDRESANRLSGVALADGLGAVGTMFDSLYDVQPLLKRLASAWLCLPVEVFSGHSLTRQALWGLMAHEGILYPLVTATSDGKFKAGWSNFILGGVAATTPSDRIVLNRIGKDLQATLFPMAVADAVEKGRFSGHDVSAHTKREDLSPSERAQKFSQALKQIESIKTLVKEGDDTRAVQFLKELVEDQTASGSTKYVVKSLCNLGKQCAEMFRTDFERRCLDQALQLEPNDAWTLIQFGDHLKRLGKFEDALETLQLAQTYATGETADVARSSIADVWASKSEYARATDIYKSIEGWEDSPTIRCALADLCRHLGDFQAAQNEYDKLQNQFVFDLQVRSRVLAGKAEIAKQRGEYQESLGIYHELTTAGDAKTQLVFRLAECHILKLDGQFDIAFQRVDNVVQKFPFCMQARIQRSALLGIMGDSPQTAYDELASDRVPVAFGEWRQRYVTGLLLLKLERFQEAKTQLREGLEAARGTREDDTILRLASAFSLVVDNDIDSAKTQIEAITASDSFTKYLLIVLDLHVACAMANLDRVEELVRQLDDSNVAVREAAHAIKSGEVIAGRRLTIGLLLSAA